MIGEKAGEKTVKVDLLLKNIAQIVCCTSDLLGDPGLIHNGAIGIYGDKIIAVGEEKNVLKNLNLPKAAAELNRMGIEVIDCKGCTVLPGFVDAHTHVVFGGSRLDEFLSGLNQKTKDYYLEKAGITGIYASVNKTREASEEELFTASKRRVEEMLAHGTTTLESKSGYGLDFETELKQLRVNKRMKEELNVDIHSTFLGAHGWPVEMGKKKYLDFMKSKVLPFIRAAKLADSCDIWCDEGHYELEECRDYLSFALNMGFKGKIHTDAYSYIGGSDLAAELGLLSADHLNYTTEESAKKLSAAGVSGIVLPGTDYSVQHKKPANPQFLKENGIRPAIGTNCNPGNCITSMQLILAFAARLEGMSPGDCICGATSRGAAALGLKDRGEIREGLLADLQIWDTERYENVFYMPGRNFVKKVIKSGKIVWECQCASEGI